MLWKQIYVDNNSESKSSDCFVHNNCDQKWVGRLAITVTMKQLHGNQHSMVEACSFTLQSVGFQSRRLGVRFPHCSFFFVFFFVVFLFFMSLSYCLFWCPHHVAQCSFQILIPFIATTDTIADTADTTTTATTTTTTTTTTTVYSILLLHPPLVYLI